MSASRFITGLTAVLLASAAFAGEVDPAKEDRASVEGRVVVDGQPLAKGRIYFHVAKGQFIGAQIQEGEYVIDRAFAVRCPVTIEGTGVAEKYADRETSALVVDLKPGENRIDFDLKSK